MEKGLTQDLSHQESYKHKELDGERDRTLLLNLNNVSHFERQNEIAILKRGAIRLPIFPLECGVFPPPLELLKDPLGSKYRDKFPLPLYLEGTQLDEYTLCLLVEYFLDVIIIPPYLHSDHLVKWIASVISFHLNSLKIHYKESGILIKDLIIFFYGMNSKFCINEESRMMLASLYLIFTSEEYRMDVKRGRSINDTIGSFNYIQKLKGSLLLYSELPSPLTNFLSFSKIRDYCSNLENHSEEDNETE